MARPSENNPQYDPLYETLPQLTQDTLRLITLSPGKFGDEIQCRLEVGAITSKYEALSYTWGLESPTTDGDDGWEDYDEGVEELSDAIQQLTTSAESSIMVNGRSIKVMSNLALALQYIRQPNEPRTLWIDYLCINQNDSSDRSTEVSRMDRIYREASRVIVWLGLETPDTGKALGEILGLAANLHLSAIYPNLNVEQKVERIAPVVSLLNRPWFSRVWVVQEVALAKEAVVQIGNRTSPWEWFIRAARVYRNHQTCCQEVLKPFNNGEDTDTFLDLRVSFAAVAVLDTEARGNLTLHRALRMFYGRLATDPRDKVFGLLGLLNSATRLVEPNYKLTAREVYEDVSTKIIQHTEDLSILIDIDEYPGDVEVASWAPDWTSIAVSGTEFYDHFKAAGSLKADARICSKHTLKISGLIFDTITEVKEFSADREDYEGELYTSYKHLKSWESAVKTQSDGPSTYASGKERDEAFWQTVQMGMSADRSRRLRLDDREGYNKWRDWLKQYDAAKDRETFLQATANDKNIKTHNEMLANYPDTRWFFLTEDGYFGLGPINIEPDDIVCVLYGGKMPFILRATDATCDVCDNDQLCYQFQGYAYVHGIMDGETVQGIERDEQAGIEFCIR